MSRKKSSRNPVCVVWWYDAARSFGKQLPKEAPPLQMTTGFVVAATSQYVNIATNVNYDSDTHELWPVDGFVIPEEAIIRFKKIGFLDHE